MSDHNDPQADHAELYAAVARKFIEAAAQFTREVNPRLSAADVSRLYLTVATALAIDQAGPAGAAALLRSVADALEAGPVVAN